MNAPTIAVIGVSPHSIRVVLSAGRIVYQGKWKYIASYIDIGKRDAAYRREFECLARWYRFKQSGVNGVSIFENICLVAR